MTRFSDTFLATDRLTRAMCGGLHPDFRAAIEAQSRFPARRAGPFGGQTFGLGPSTEHIRPFPARPDDERQVG
ncbi:hypothetical protein [Pseudotabrizicola sp. 4114]|uniref:hypothetical protein n=1 Tax=Pseudotabrizicola sp. 4114 TaxID=2817731 RepID=UPI00285BE560|nr:hypothetical protein [Pseudorhodobacter sp. 4114]